LKKAKVPFIGFRDKTSKSTTARPAVEKHIRSFNRAFTALNRTLMYLYRAYKKQRGFLSNFFH